MGRTALRLGLTGGIGSGKSTVAQRLSAHGAAVIDADALSRALTAPGGAAIPAIAAQFGAQIIAADGGLDRARMRQQVFDDAVARQRLEAIVHPLIHAQIDHQVQQAQARGAGVIVFDIPLLAEGGPRWRRQLDGVCVVDCSEATQIARVMARNGLTREQVLSIMASQATRSARLSVADGVLLNDGIDLPGLHARVDALAAGLPL